MTTTLAVSSRWAELSGEQQLSLNREINRIASEAHPLDPVGYVSGFTHSDDIIFACGGHTHRVSRQDALRLANVIKEVTQ